LDFSSCACELALLLALLLVLLQGMWLLSNLVAAINPHDLDALDENVPFTKFTLDGRLYACCGVCFDILHHAALFCDRL
jgi:hypothetical protein